MSAPRLAVASSLRIRSVVRACLVRGAAGLGALLVGSALWIRRTFGTVSVDQMLMNLGGGGADAPQGYLWSFAWQAVLLPLVALILLRLLLVWGCRAVSHRWRQSGRSFVVMRRRKAASGIGRWGGPLSGAAVLGLGIAVFGQTVGVGQFVHSFTTPLTMEEYYVAPAASAMVAAAPDPAQERPKNLITIYLESGEKSYGDDSLFEFDMNAPLDEVTRGWAEFDSLSMYEGGGWTMAGIVGTECGVPLRGPGVGVNDINSNDIGAESAEYLPNAVCLGDVLSSSGYTSVFMGGADADFASKRSFLTAHGYDRVMDLGTWEEEGETEISTWGLSDRRLMERAKQEVSTLHEGAQPFHLSLLTLDTHEPVHVFDYCPVESEEEMTSVIRCSMQQVAGFVGYLEEKGYLDDTVVVIVGDHPKMLGEEASFTSELAGLEERPLYNRMWLPDHRRIERTSIDQLSLYATMLDAVGAGRPDGRAGIGVSALLPGGSEVGALALSDEDYDTMVRSRSSSMYRALWDAEGGEQLEVAGEECGSERGGRSCS